MKKYNYQILQRLVDIIENNSGINILEKGRKQDKVVLFKIFCYYVRFQSKLRKTITLEQIADFTNKNHATILHACNTYNDLHFSNKEFRNKAEELYVEFEKLKEINPVKANLLHLVGTFSEKSAAYWLKRIRLQKHITSHMPIMNSTFHKDWDDIAREIRLTEIESKMTQKDNT